MSFNEPMEPVDEMESAINERIIADLMTCLDVCDAMAHLMMSEPAGSESAYCAHLAIFDVHDVANVLTGGDSMQGWGLLRGFIADTEDKKGSYGPAWPDVRSRMADVLARAERMVEQ